MGYLSTNDSSSYALVSLQVSAALPAGTVTARVAVPAGSCHPVEILPALRIIDEAIIAHARAGAEEAGAAVSCRKGCGGCCRQLVPVPPMEARRLLALLESLPAPRRGQYRQRFAAAIRILAEAGMLNELREIRSLTGAPLRRLVKRYFRLGIPCPFLEDDSCSIHPERPLVCREYLVTSAPRECAKLGKIDRIPVPGRLSPRLGRDQAGRPAWIPLVLVPERTAELSAADAATALRPGTELLTEALRARPVTSASAAAGS